MSDQNYNVNVTYSVDDGLSPQLEVMADNMEDVTTDAEDQQKEIDKTSSSWKNMAKAIGLTALAMKGLSFGKKATEAFMVQDKANKAVALSFGDGADAMRKYASQLQETTGIGDETSLMFASMLKNMGRTTEETKNILSASADLVAGSGGMISMDTAVRGLAQSYYGSAQSLTRYLPSLKELTAEQMKAGGAIDMITKSYGGMAEEMLNTPSGMVQKLTNDIGDQYEVVGEQLIPAQIEWMKLQKGVIKNIGEMAPLLAGITKTISVFAGALLSIVGGNKIVYGITAITAGVGALAFAINAGTLSMASFNAVLLANPIGIATVAVIALVAGMNSLTSSMNRSSDAIGEFATASKGTYEDVNQKMVQYGNLQEKGKARTKEETALMKSLYKELKTITGQKVKYNKASGEAYLVDKSGTETSIRMVQTHIRAIDLRAKGAEDAEKQREKDAEKQLKADEEKKKAEMEELKRIDLLKANRKKADDLALSMKEKSLQMEKEGADRSILIVNQRYDKERKILLSKFSQESQEIKTLEALRAGEILTIKRTAKQKEIDDLKLELDEKQQLRDDADAIRVSKEIEAEALRRESAKEGLDLTSQYLQTSSDLFSGITDKKMRDLDRETKKQIEAVEKSTASEEEKAKKISEIEKKASGAKYKLDMAEWGNNLGMAIGNTALAVTKTMASIPFPANVPFAIAQGVAGAVQVGTVISNKPQKMSEGGDLQGGSTATDSVTYQGNPGEKVINKGRTRKLNRMIDRGELGGNKNYHIETPITINGNADQGIVDQLKEVSNDFVDKTVRALELATEQNKIDPSRFAFA